MNKREFLDALKNALIGLPDDDVQKSLDFYSEMIDDRIEDGLSEQEAVAAIGEPQEIAKQILADIPITKLVRQKIKPKRRISALEIVLLILGSPIWLSLIIAVMAVVFAVYVSLWSVIISLYSVAAAFVASAVGGVVSGVVFICLGKGAVGAFMLGAGLLCLGLGIFMFMVSNLVAKGLIWTSKKIWLCVKSCFIRKGDSNEKI